MTSAEQALNRCPVCQARFRGAATCSRCQADLARLMAISARAWHLREAARTALAKGDFAAAHTLADTAEQGQATQSGAALQHLAACFLRLETVAGPPPNPDRKEGAGTG